MLKRLMGGIGLVAVAAALWGCSGGASDAQKVAAQIAGGSDSFVCRLFTREEIAAAAGEPVAAGENAGPLGSGCHWMFENSDERGVMIQIVPRDYWEDGTHQPGGEALSGIGEKAFVGPFLDEHRAGALTANGAVYVVSPKREISVALLNQAAPRVPPPQESK